MLKSVIIRTIFKKEILLLVNIIDYNVFIIYIEHSRNLMFVFILYIILLLYIFIYIYLNYLFYKIIFF